MSVQAFICKCEVLSSATTLKQVDEMSVLLKPFLSEGARGVTKASRRYIKGEGSGFPEARSG